MNFMIFENWTMVKIKDYVCTIVQNEKDNKMEVRVYNSKTSEEIEIEGPCACGNISFTQIDMDTIASTTIIDVVNCYINDVEETLACVA